MGMFLLSAITSVALLASGVAAQNAPALSKSASKTTDPNKMRCVVQRETGSHLSGKRVCKTLAQWAEERQQEREQVEASRRGRSSNNGGL